MLLHPFSADLVFYTVTDVAAGTTAGLQNISAFEEEDGTLISSLAVEGVATGTGDRTFRVDIMTESDFSDAVSVEAKVFIIPPILSILPPVMIIFVAVLSKSVLLSLSSKYGNGPPTFFCMSAFFQTCTYMLYVYFRVKIKKKIDVFPLQLGCTLLASSPTSSTYSKLCKSPEHYTS